MDRDERSYKRYKQYRRNKYRYEQEQITFPIAVILGLALFIRYWYIVIAIAAIILAFIIFRKVRMKNVTKSTETGLRTPVRWCKHSAGHGALIPALWCTPSAKDGAPMPFPVVHGGRRLWCTAAMLGLYL